eukprot:TRINITY_DN7337_c0_g1_i2.p1 TRINITY_DN7337_c0_g1~~TRINITY_DN7337_c0_g1_i2.p1  ORF type:complete len:722 (+),score=112.85 TRINITY_DN7337_c0_g1_i2:97-2262(+)
MLVRKLGRSTFRAYKRTSSIKQILAMQTEIDEKISQVARDIEAAVKDGRYEREIQLRRMAVVLQETQKIILHGAQRREPRNKTNPTSAEAQRREPRNKTNPTSAEVFTDLLAFFKKHGKPSQKETFPFFEGRFLQREQAMQKIDDYFSEVINRKWDKCPILAGYGVPGCGKTRMLFEVLKTTERGCQQNGLAVLKFGPRTRTLYISFNGAFSGINTHFKSITVEQLMAVAIVFHVVEDGAIINDVPHLSALTVETALHALREYYGLAADDALIIGVDEVLLVDSMCAGSSSDLLSYLGGCQQRSVLEHKPTIFLFSSLLNSVLRRVPTRRIVREIDFPPLGLDQIFTICPALKYIFAGNNRAAQMLLLECAGHPRAIFDNLIPILKGKEILQPNAQVTLCSSECTVIRQTIMNGIKIHTPAEDLVLEYLNGTLSEEMKDQWRAAGLLIPSFTHLKSREEGEILFPLALRMHAHSSTTAFGYNLARFYKYDDLFDVCAEHYLEDMLCQFTMLKRRAAKGKPVPLQVWYAGATIPRQWESHAVQFPDPPLSQVVDFQSPSLVNDCVHKKTICMPATSNQFAVDHLFGGTLDGVKFAEVGQVKAGTSQKHREMFGKMHDWINEQKAMHQPDTVLIPTFYTAWSYPDDAKLVLPAPKKPETDEQKQQREATNAKALALKNTCIFFTGAGLHIFFSKLGARRFSVMHPQMAERIGLTIYPQVDLLV